MQRFLLQFTLMVAAIVFFCGILFFGIHVIPYQIQDGFHPFLKLGNLQNISLFISGLGLLGYIIVVLLPDRNQYHPTKRWHKIIWLTALILSTPFAITKALFGVNELEPIVIFFLDNQIDDIITIGADSFTGPLGFWSALLLVILGTSFLLLSYKKHFEKVLILLSCILFALSPLVQYIKNSIVPNTLQRNFTIADHMHPPVILKKPEASKNLVLIYLESVERSYGQIPEFEPFFKPLKTLSDQSTDYTNVIQTAGTNYTTAGLVATQCGIPLIARGLHTVFFKNNIAPSFKNFLPSVHCLGDQLSADGYTLSYMNGASLDKFSKRSFLRNHGYTRLFDEAAINDDLKTGRTNIWGLNDALLFEQAKEEFDTLSSIHTPFVQSILTLSTHSPNGFLDRDCAPVQHARSQIPRAIQCTGNLIRDFVNHIHQSSVGHETVIVIMSDHLAFFNSARRQLETIGPNRRNLFIVLTQSETGKINRAITLFDVYPILLETLGYTLKDGRANLGVSTQSVSKNMVEEFGRNGLNKIFKSNQNLAAYFWQTSEN